ncbi:MobC family plasmid mobilization relaxosome protein [Agromyces sp. SYSU K20354]|uniref:plasmid mobilization relaxosome protein MobC n=1 Tax=Agromyces cavernae TaxID=2898659 RepID=UPI001E4CF77B|nr:plasmid mobilization relaxosome protein MobC [Agromyces cavernae]MCD2444368.1 MobC family plasmid mobilization relaxosome protein [Agromyces cavernae]
MTDETSPKAPGSRRRRANAEGGRHHFHKVKVTPEEEGRLAAMAAAQRVTIPRLLVESTFAQNAGTTVTERRDAQAELFRIHRLLAASSNNINQIAKATNATGEIQAELLETLKAHRRIAANVTTAIDGLGLQ